MDDPYRARCRFGGVAGRLCSDRSRHWLFLFEATEEEGEKEEEKGSLSLGYHITASSEIGAALDHHQSQLPTDQRCYFDAINLCICMILMPEAPHAPPRIRACVSNNNLISHWNLGSDPICR